MPVDHAYTVSSGFDWYSVAASPVSHQSDSLTTRYVDQLRLDLEIKFTPVQLSERLNFDY